MRTTISTALSTVIALVALAWSPAPAAATSSDLLPDLFEALDKTGLALMEAGVEIELVAVETKQIRRDVLALAEAFEAGDADAAEVEAALDEAEASLELLRDRAKELRNDLDESGLVLSEIHAAERQDRSRLLRIAVRKAFRLLATNDERLARADRAINRTRRDIEQLREAVAAKG